MNADLIISEGREGDIITANQRIIIKAHFHGDIANPNGQVFVEHGGKVKGDIVCKNGLVVIENGGYVKGDIVCKELDIKEGGEHKGDAVTGR